MHFSYRKHSLCLPQFRNGRIFRRVSGLLTARFILRLREYHGRDTGKSADEDIPDISTFQVAASRLTPSNAVIDEFGEDYLALAARQLEEESELSAVREAHLASCEDEDKDLGTDSAAIATLEVDRDRRGPSFRRSGEHRRPEFLQGCSSETEGIACV